MRRPPRPTLFPSAPLFRSEPALAVHRLESGVHRRADIVEDRAVERAAELQPIRLGEEGAELAKLGVDLALALDRKSTRLNSSHANISYAVFCLKKKKENKQ